MKKKLTLMLVLFCFILSNTYSQSIYYDAFNLKNIEIEGDTAQLFNTLQKYSDVRLSDKNCKAIFIDNQYIIACINATYSRIPLFVKDTSVNFSSLEISGNKFNLGSALSKFGGVDVTNIADGFAKFIVKRTKEELNIAFFEKFKELISKEEYVDMRTVFPQTYKALNVVGNEIYNYKGYLQTLRECFEKDLDNIPVNMESIITNHSDFFEQQKELKSMLQTGFYISRGIKDKQHPAEILSNYDESILKNFSPDYMAGIKTLKLFSSSLQTDIVDDSYWISQSKLRELLNDSEFFNIYLGLILERAKKDQIAFNNETQKLHVLINNSFSKIADLEKYKAFIFGFVQKTSLIETKLKGLNEHSKDSVLVENYYNFFTSIIDLLQYSAEVNKLPYLGSINISDKTKKYLSTGQATADILIDVNRKNYGSALIDVIQVYSAAFPQSEIDMDTARINKKLRENLVVIEKIKVKQKDLKKAKTEEEKMQIKKDIEMLVALHITTALDSLKLQVELYHHNNLKTITNNIYKYGTFMAAVATAKSSDEMESAIEAFALPSGSARIKKESVFNVSLNAYCGLYAGQEIQNCFGFQGRSTVLNSYGLTAPIGLAFSWGHPLCKAPKYRASSSFFLSVVDIGAITSFRFQNDSIQTLSKIELKDIISPGVFYSFGFPKAPISINVGYQITPFLREVATTDNTFKPSYQRLSISLLVDIPLMNFYTRSRE